MKCSVSPMTTSCALKVLGFRYHFVNAVKVQNRKLGFFNSRTPRKADNFQNYDISSVPLHYSEWTLNRLGWCLMIIAACGAATYVSFELVAEEDVERISNTSSQLVGKNFL